MEYEQGKGIFDSNIINVYLDEKYPDVSLQPTDPLRRAQDKMLVEQLAGVRYSFVISYNSNNFNLIYNN